MSLLLLFGLLLLAYGPTAVLLLSYVGRRSALLLIAIFSALIWLVAIFLPALLYLLLPPAQPLLALLTGVVVEEAARFLSIHLYALVEVASDALPIPAPVLAAAAPPLKLLNDAASALSLGVGFGGAAALFLYGGVLLESVSGEGWYLDHCPQMSGFVYTACLAALLAQLHLALSVLAVDAYRRAGGGVRGWGSSGRVWAPLALHAAFSLSTLLTPLTGGGCVGALCLCGGVATLATGWAWRCLTAPDAFVNRQVKAWEARVGERRAPP